MINYVSAPNDCGDAWQRYVEYGILPGSFCVALLRNDVIDAIHRADNTNIRLIPAHLEWMTNNLPAECWGSNEAISAWVKARREERL